MKLKSKLQLGAVFMGMLMLVACGGEEKHIAPPPVKPPVTTPVTPAEIVTFDIASLAGSWITPCQASKSLTGYDEQQIFNFNGDKLTTHKIFYVQNTNCKHSDEALRTLEVANIALGETVNPGSETGHTKINITTKKVILAPMNSTLTALLNNTGHTGNQSIYNGYDQGWSTTFWRNLSNIPDARTNFKIDQSVPDIFKISTVTVDGQTNKVLKLSVKGGNVDSDGRPLSLANSITATLQKKTTQTQTPQAAGLIGQWKYACRLAKGHSDYLQQKTLDFNDDKLKTSIIFYQKTHSMCTDNSKLLYQVAIESDIVVGKVINAGAVDEHTQIGIKTTNVKINLNSTPNAQQTILFNAIHFYLNPVTNLYYGYGQKNWPTNDWRDISSVPDAITNLNIGTQVPNIFKISTVTGGRKELKMGDYQGSFDINGRAISLEAKGAASQ